MAQAPRSAKASCRLAQAVILDSRRKVAIKTYNPHTARSADPEAFASGRRAADAEGASSGLRFFWQARGAWGDHLVAVMASRLGLQVAQSHGLTSDAQRALEAGYNARAIELTDAQHGAGSVQSVLQEVDVLRQRQYDDWAHEEEVLGADDMLAHGETSTSSLPSSACGSSGSRATMRSSRSCTSPPTVATAIGASGVCQRAHWSTVGSAARSTSTSSRKSRFLRHARQHASARSGSLPIPVRSAASRSAPAPHGAGPVAATTASPTEGSLTPEAALPNDLRTDGAGVVGKAPDTETGER